MSIVSKNPATGEELVRYDALSGQAVTQKVQRAEEAFRLWHRTPFQERADILRRIADILESEKQRWGELMSSCLLYTSRVLESCGIIESVISGTVGIPLSGTATCAAACEGHL